MKQKIGTIKNSISHLELDERVLTQNTLILAQEGSGKTHLANIIRNFVMDHDVPTLYLDFSDPDIDGIEARYKEHKAFFYIRFEESEAFDTAFCDAVARREHIYMAVNPSFFGNKRDVKSRLSQTIQKPELLDHYYYFFHEIALLNAFYNKFEDFMYYMLSLVTLKKFGLTFLTQPHQIFEDQKVKLVFSYLYIGKCSNTDYYDADLRTLPMHTFVHQHREDKRTLLFNTIYTNTVMINH
ncbi:MAG: ATP-binding protein [Thiovulaceae bacterium]|nr:ATP-binding protein [Sulfurimonadaceae bacterium]